MYLWYAWLRHRLRRLMTWCGVPALAADVAAPILRLWVLKDPARKPASWRARGRCCRQRAGVRGFTSEKVKRGVAGEGVWGRGFVYFAME